MSDDKTGTGGNQPYTQAATQAQRRAMLKQDDTMRTYFEMAQGEGEEGQTPVVGATPFGPKLPAPAWAMDAAAMVPPEPPIGEDIYALPDCSGIGRAPATAEAGDAEEA